MRKFLLILFVIICSMGINGPVKADPIQWKVEDGGNDHFYEAVSSTVGWNDAKDLAESSFFNGLQGHLVTMTNETENSWVWDNLGDVTGYFLGGIDEDEEGVWEWITGEEWSYTSWNTGEPNNSTWLLATGEDALQFANNGLWNDIPVSGYYGGGYIVEYEVAPVPEPATILLMGSGLVGLFGLRRRIMGKGC